MKKVLFLIIYLLVCIKSNGQNVVAKVLYRQQEIPKQNAAAKRDVDCILLFNSSQSLYYETSKNRVSNLKSGADDNVENIELDSGNDGLVFFNYQDYQSKKLSSNEAIFSRKYFVQEKIVVPKWVITKEYKKIGSFKCQKAKAFYRDRNYMAWFTTEIPSLAGPWKLQGLPGLILEAESEDGEVKFLFESLIFNPKNEKIAILKTYGKPMTLADFVEIRKKVLRDTKKSFESKMTQFGGGYEFNVNTFSKENFLSQ
ncbi:GLPGLI family protein [Siphonobacter sp. SORGH_AS_0500]|uniref:GLPGLI family protein n=1 Tax=Siphonobacter sp. SORGH_AS_0500 TaxID=1864824 RepID=UPI0028650CBB|nr:GLPGLI family protein [Siphonobacter sp. SORGH_AS_0500]MDR6194580.1 GLPGLI family protein [Siphonobacter sp. SORGH_AS_0500]